MGLQNILSSQLGDVTKEDIVEIWRLMQLVALNNQLNQPLRFCAWFCVRLFSTFLCLCAAFYFYCASRPLAPLPVPHVLLIYHTNSTHANKLTNSVDTNSTYTHSLTLP